MNPCTNVYILNDAQRRNALRATSEKDFFTDWVALLTGVEPPRGVPRFGPHIGMRAFDIIATTYAALYLISNSVIETLSAGRFRGWRTYPVELYDRHERAIKGYHGLIITGKCGPVLWDKAEQIEITTFAGHRGVACKGLVFDPATHDGSDMFGPQGTGYILVSGSVKKAMEDAKLTNVEFEPITEFLRTWDLPR